MPQQPGPIGGTASVESLAVISDLEGEVTFLFRKATGRPSGPAVFGDVLKCLQTAEIHRRLHLLGITRYPVGNDLDGNHGFTGLSDRAHTSPSAASSGG